MKLSRQKITIIIIIIALIEFNIELKFEQKRCYNTVWFICIFGCSHVKRIKRNSIVRPLTFWKVIPWQKELSCYLCEASVYKPRRQKAMFRPLQFD